MSQDKKGAPEAQKLLFIVSTPYQIICALQLLQTLPFVAEVDLCILNQFSSAEILAEKLKKQNLFSDIFLIRYDKINRGNFAVRSFRKFFTYFRYKKEAEEYFPKNKIYDGVYFSYLDFIIEFAVSYYKTKNPELSVNLFEDGTASYVVPECIVKPSRLRYMRFVSRLTGMPLVTESIDRFYVFDPVLAVPRSDGRPKDQLKKIDPTDKERIALYNELFDFDLSTAVDKRFILMEQAFNGTPPDGYQLDFFARMKDRLADDSYIMKLHPRTLKAVYENFHLYPYSGIPWEILCMNSRMDDKVLICYYSTASFTPKMLFGQEPELIFFPELYPPEEGQKDWLAHIQRLKNSYSHPERVHVPASFEELDEIMKKIGGEFYRLP